VFLTIAEKKMITPVGIKSASKQTVPFQVYILLSFIVG